MSFERMRARAERVKIECDLGALLQEYGYAVFPDRHREQQFSCDLHGVDNSPSARLYGHNNTTYCWACGKTRDPISYVMEKELKNFRGAVEYLEKKMGLPPLPWSDEQQRPVTVEDEITKIEKVSTTVTYEQAKQRLGKFLESLTTDRDVGASALLSFWEVYDRVDYGVARENWEEHKGAAAMEGLRERVMQKLKEVGG
jgi:hypothetical protein